MKKLLIIVFALLIAACGRPTSQPEAMLAENLNCPDGSHSEIERWGGVGENGWLHACKMNHGLFTTWSGEVKAVEGNYVNGKKEGVWSIWNKEGKKQKEITYKGGKEVSVKEFK